MIILDNTNRKLEVVLAGAITTNQLPIVAGYIDYTATSSFTPGASQTQSNSTTAVTAIAAPAGSAVRQVKFLQVQNADTVNATVTVRYNDNGTTRSLVVITLNVNDQLNYEDGRGWTVISTAGALKSLGLLSGQVTSGFLGNASVVSGSMASGQIGGFFVFASGGITASGSVQYGAIASGAINSGDMANASVVSGSIASGQIGQFHLASGNFTLGSGNWFDNKLINGGMNYAQRQTPTVLTAITSGALATDTYSADRWKCACSSGVMVNYYRWDTLNSGFASGAVARFYGRWIAGGSGKFSIYQPIEAVNSLPLANTTLSFQAKIRTGQASSGLIMQMGILQTISGITIDAIPNSIASGWSLATSGTNPSWSSGVALLGPTTTVIPTSGIWAVFTNIVAALSGHVNLIPSVWANQPLASGATLDMTEVGLYCD